MALENEKYPDRPAPPVTRTDHDSEFAERCRQFDGDPEDFGRIITMWCENVPDGRRQLARRWLNTIPNRKVWGRIEKWKRGDVRADSWLHACIVNWASYRAEQVSAGDEKAA